MNNGRGESDPELSVSYGVINGHHGTILVLSPAPKTQLPAEVVEIYPTRPGHRLYRHPAPGGTVQPEGSGSG